MLGTCILRLVYYPHSPLNNDQLKYLRGCSETRYLSVSHTQPRAEIPHALDLELSVSHDQGVRGADLLPLLLYRVTSLTSNSTEPEPYSRAMPRALWWSERGVLSLLSEVPLYTPKAF